MSEEKKTEKLTVKKPALEQIEMTAEQKDKFLAFMEAEEIKAIQKKDAEEFKGLKTKVNLQFKHNLNGKSYGPGRQIQIPMELLGLLQQQENQSRDAELRMLTSNKRIFEVLQSGGSIEVGGHRVPSILR